MTPKPIESSFISVLQASLPWVAFFILVNIVAFVFLTPLFKLKTRRQKAWVLTTYGMVYHDDSVCVFTFT